MDLFFEDKVPRGLEFWRAGERRRVRRVMPMQ